MYFGTHQPWTVHMSMEGDIYTETSRKRRQAVYPSNSKEKEKTDIRSAMDEKAG